MTTPSDELAASTATSSLGILHLKRYWAKMMAIRQGRLAGDAFEDEQDLDVALLNVLDLGLEPTIQYLFQAVPSFSEFEAWIQVTTNKSLNTDKVTTFNARLLGNAPRQSSLRSSELTLSDDDLIH